MANSLIAEFVYELMFIRNTRQAKYVEWESPLRLSQQIKMSVDFCWNNFSVRNVKKRKQ